MDILKFSFDNTRLKYYNFLFMSAVPTLYFDQGSLFDSAKLVNDRQRVKGVLHITQLPRLADSLFNHSGALASEVQGVRDAQDRPLLRLQVKGDVVLQCQRCMEGMVHGIDINTAVRLVAPEWLEREQDDDPDEPDCIAASAMLDLAAVVEDEVLLALPAYPRHADGLCAAAAKDGSTTEPKIKVFDALQALKPEVNR